MDLFFWGFYIIQNVWYLEDFISAQSIFKFKVMELHPEIIESVFFLGCFLLGSHHLAVSFFFHLAKIYLLFLSPPTFLLGKVPCKFPLGMLLPGNLGKAFWRLVDVRVPRLAWKEIRLATLEKHHTRWGSYPPEVWHPAPEHIPFQIGKVYSLPTTIFQGRSVKFEGGGRVFVQGFDWLYLWPWKEF